jgi:aspartate racemase
VKVIGLLGGMSWESSIVYEQILNEEARRRLGGMHSADLLIRSYDFAVVERLQSAGEWEQAGRLLADGARALEAAGAELLVLCTNTMHKVADMIAAAVAIPFLHIADVTAGAIKAAELAKVGLLGTRYTMERDFYRGRLQATHGLAVLVPDEPDRTLVHQIIYDELVQGIIRDESRTRYLEVIGRLQRRGAEGIVAGCTEIELLVQAGDLSLPYFPTTRLHALAALDMALAGS